MTNSQETPRERPGNIPNNPHRLMEKAATARRNLKSAGAPEAETAPPPTLRIPPGPIFKSIPPEKPRRNDKFEKPPKYGVTEFDIPSVDAPEAEVKIEAKIRQLKEFIGTENLAIIDISARDCKPCKSLKPLFHELAAKGLSYGSDHAGFAYFNQNSLGDKISSQSLEKFLEKYGVENYPTLLVFKKGKLIIRAEGTAANRAALEKRILDLLSAFAKHPGKIIDFPPRRRDRDNTLPPPLLFKP